MTTPSTVATEHWALCMALYVAMGLEARRKDSAFLYRRVNKKKYHLELTPYPANPHPSQTALGCLLTSGASCPQRLSVSGVEMGILPLASSFEDGSLRGTPCSLVFQTPLHTHTGISSPPPESPFPLRDLPDHS